MGVSANARWAALTNFRNGFNEIKDAPSRGALVVDFLESSQTPKSYAADLVVDEKVYNGYNLLLGSHESLYYHTNQHSAIQELDAGIYGLSNHLLDTPWPKVSRGKEALKQCLRADEPDNDQLFAMLVNKELAPDYKLPDTGIPYEWEKLLSAMYIESPDYGTRVSTVLLQDYEGNMFIEERSHKPVGDPVSFAVLVGKD